MSGVPYSFEGQHRRLPRQNLRGKIVKEPTKVALIERAQTCRSRREKERVMEVSIKIIQAVVRGFLVRARLKKEFEAQYWEIAKREDCDTLESHGEQIARLLKFFDGINQKNGVAFSKHASQMVRYRAEIASKCCNSPVWAMRISNFIRLGVLWYLRSGDGKTNSNRTSCHRTGLEFFKAIFYECENEPQTDWTNSLKFFLKIWLDLSTSVNFFHVWHNEYEIALRDTRYLPVSERAIIDKTDDVISILKIFFDFLSRLEEGPSEYVLDKKLDIWKRYPNNDSNSGIASKEMVSCHLLNLFTESFVIGHSIRDDTYLSSGELVFALITRRDVVGQDNFPWKDWLMTLTPARYLHYEDKGRKAIRHLLCAAISALPSDMTSDVDVEILQPIATILSRLLPSVDDRFETSLHISDLTLPEDEEDDDEHDMLVENEDEGLAAQRKELRRYVFERDYVIGKLGVYLRPLPVASWIASGKIAQEAVDTLISCLVCNNEKEELLQDFPFLGQLAYNGPYMCQALKQLFDGDQVKDGNQLITFVWLFHTLMKTFHDVEFTELVLPDISQFGRLVAHLVTKYTNSILGIGSSLHSTDVELKLYTTFLCALHERNTTTRLFPEEIFQSHSLALVCPVRSHSMTDDDFLLGKVETSSVHEQSMWRVLKEYPFALPFQDRVAAWHRMIDNDKQERFVPHARRSVLRIRRNMLYEDTFEKVLSIRQIRDPITISLVNSAGILEAGVDGGGLLREFLIEATKAGVDPNRGIFRGDSQNRIYPNPIAQKIIPDFSQHFYLIGRLVGKALYEKTFLELPFSGFFLQKCIEGDVDRPVDYLATLDPALHSNLLGLKTFTGDFTSLGLDFTLTFNELGETKTVALKKDGGSIAVDQNNVIEYIHLVANYKINKEVARECLCFRAGLNSAVAALDIFSWRELQTLISGSDKPIDIEDWKQNTNYSAGYQAVHPCIKMFWQVLEGFNERHLRKLLKFVTSCSRPPIHGFKDLTPNFGIQSAGAGTSDRLPTAATCMNLLKLPEYEDMDTLREKLIYAIEAEAGFELS